MTNVKERFESLGVLYDKNEFGVIIQVDPKPFIYDAKYSATYDTFSYKKGADILNGLRYGFACAAHRGHIGSILDCGYGNGAFMKFAKQQTKEVFGYDVTGIPVDGCTIVGTFSTAPVDVITFWDCLEHFHNIDFLGDIKAETICISLPYCHFNNIHHDKGLQEAVKWFDTWKHRKPDEHIRHFNRGSLKRTMQHYGWNEVAYSHHEDIVRISPMPMNILSMAFKRG